MKRQRTLIGLAAVAVLLAAMVLLDRDRPTTDERAAARDRLLSSFHGADVHELAVTRGLSTTTLTHEAGGWYTTSPHRRADDAAVAGLLTALETSGVERRVTRLDDASRAALGLDTPRVTVRAGGHTLAIGRDAPGRLVYVQRDGEPTALVADHRLVESADLDPSLWRSRALTLTAPDEASRIGAGDWQLDRRGGWHTTRPLALRASAAKADALLQTLMRARAQRELPDAPAPAAPPAPASAAPAASELASGATPAAAPARAAAADDARALTLDDRVEARLAGACPGAPSETLVLRADGAALCFAAADVDLLRAPASTFYERRLFPLALDDLVAADVGPLSLRRADGRWRIVAPAQAAGPARDEAVRAALEPLLAAKARAFAPATPVRGLHIRLATRDDEVSVDVDGARAHRAGEEGTLELATPLAPAIDSASLREPSDLGR